MEEESYCLKESQNYFESKIAEWSRFIDLKFLIEQLRKGYRTCSSWEEVAVQVSFLTLTAFSSKIGLLKLSVKTNVRSIILQTIEALQ